MVVIAEHQTVRQLYERHADELMRFATSVAGPDNAADVVSIAFVGALGSPDWTRVDNQRAYLYRSVLNAARTSARSDGRRSRREDVAAGRQVTAMPTVVGADPDPDIWRAVSALSDRQRAVVYLTYWMDMTTEQIAALLDLSTGSVKKHLDRGRTALRNTLGGER